MRPTAATLYNVAFAESTVMAAPPSSLKVNLPVVFAGVGVLLSFLQAAMAIEIKRHAPIALKNEMGIAFMILIYAVLLIVKLHNKPRQKFQPLKYHQNGIFY